ncbi:MAG: hypothetical protein KTR21_14485 [Rhodobacteraceae bacterium]|nr:hypothetical protein [Paracoccaceae bacterium]
MKKGRHRDGLYPKRWTACGDGGHHGQVSPEKAHWIDLKDHGAAEIAAVEAQIYATLPNPEEIASIEVSSRLCSIRGAPCF